VEEERKSVDVMGLAWWFDGMCVVIMCRGHGD